MGKADRISGIFWLVFSIFVMIESYRLGLGTLHQPGAGFLFFWGSILLGMMSLVIVVRAGGYKNSQQPESFHFREWKPGKIAPVLISLFLYSFLMEKVGFIPMTFFLFIFLLGVIEKKKWFFTLTVSVVVTALTYLIFEIWLKSQLPKGLLESLRF